MNECCPLDISGFGIEAVASGTFSRDKAEA